jgi:hypothetical protein
LQAGVVREHFNKKSTAIGTSLSHLASARGARFGERPVSSVRACQNRTKLISLSCKFHTVSSPSRRRAKIVSKGEPDGQGRCKGVGIIAPARPLLRPGHFGPGMHVTRRRRECRLRSNVLPVCPCLLRTDLKSPGHRVTFTAELFVRVAWRGVHCRGGGTERSTTGTPHVITLLFGHFAVGASVPTRQASRSTLPGTGRTSETCVKR